VAVIERSANGQRQWLVQWNAAWKAYNLVGGHKRGRESYRECLVRELGEELELEPLVDYTVDAESDHRLEFEAWSERAHQLTYYEMELFRVQLTPAAELRVNTNPDNRWLTDKEIINKQTHDGQPVSETIYRLLESVGELGTQHPST
jgi:hypothetical protein